MLSRIRRATYRIHINLLSRRCFATRIGFVGAGNVNFGGGEGPWDHSKRIEQAANSGNFGDIKVVAVADMNVNHANNIIAERKSKYPKIYGECQAFSNWQDMIGDKSLNLNAIIIGTPPASRGSLRDGYDMELQCIKKGLDVLVEKPVSMDESGDFLKYAIEVNEQQCLAPSVRDKNRSPIISVGYMFRYHPAIKKMMEILNGRDILHVNLRYQTAYPRINKQFWWDQLLSGGPIVEQGTHFVDIARYLCGECRMDTLMTNAVFYKEKGLKKMPTPPNLDEIKPDMVNQIITCAQWKSDKGAMVSLSHGVHLHGSRYESYIDVWADGVSMNLSNPYDDVCQLRVRDNQKEENLAECTDTTYVFDVNAKDEYDPYWMEMKTFLEAVHDKEDNLRKAIKSDFDDAGYTYILTMDIQEDVMKKVHTSK